MKRLNKNKGITLIALVITIIVMLILVGVSISMAVNGGLFNYAGKAVGETNKAITEENKIGEGGVTVDGNVFTSIDDYIDETKKENYIGYYADVDGDGEADGVIYADLAFSNSGIWNPGENTTTYATTGGTWSYSAKSNLKKYVVCKESYEGVFGTKPVIKASSTEGADRFYVMALEDIKATIDGTEYTGFYWYNEAKTSGISDYTNYTCGFETGKTNTYNMINEWNKSTYGAQNNKDVWKVIQKTVYGVNNEKETKTVDDVIWFLPSANEWAAFADTFDITKENYNGTYGLGDRYWLSSLNDSKHAYAAAMQAGFVLSTTNSKSTFNNTFLIRLSATF